MDLVIAIYRLTKEFPRDEQWGLTSQIRRAAVSIPSNIAEGYGRAHRPEYLHFLSIARGSLMEAETQLQIAVRLEYANRQAAREVWGLLQEVGRLLNKLVKSLETNRLAEDDNAYSLDPFPEPRTLTLRKDNNRSVL